ncbi:MAG: SseB family protein [Actinomycetales bacterium]
MSSSERGSSEWGSNEQGSSDVGAPDPNLRQALRSVGDDQLPSLLGRERLLLVLHGLPPAPDSGRSTAMGLVTMINADDQRGLLAFTGMDALQAWSVRADHPAARPYPQPAAVCAQLALDHGCSALVIDVMGPHRRVIAAGLLDHLAQTSDPTL